MIKIIYYFFGNLLNESTFHKLTTSVTYQVRAFSKS
jgi:hypothetical protein